MFLPPPRGTNAPTAVGSSRPTPDPKGGKALVLSLKDDKLQREEREKSSYRAHKQAKREREREQWGKGSRHGRLEGEEEAGRSGRVGSVIITAAKAALMWETQQRCEWRHGGERPDTPSPAREREQHQNQRG